MGSLRSLSLTYTVLSLGICCCVTLSQATTKYEIRMPGIKPETEDYYVCTSFKVTEESYITQYEALAEAGTAHHILMFGCDQPASSSDRWECGSTCKGRSSIMYAWAKNADPTKLPPDVGYHIGGSSGINYIVMQVHYARVLTADEPADHSGIAIYTSAVKPKYTQGIYLLATGNGRIPPQMKGYSTGGLDMTLTISEHLIHTFVETHLDISCKFKGRKAIHPFAFRTHAHTLSVVISAYRRPADQPQAGWEMLGKGNPQWPQAFYPMDKPHTIEHGDIIVGRCVYNSMARNTATYIGSTHNDEMCNFYMMYYVEGEAEFLECGGNRLPGQARSMPASSLQALPPNPKLDEKASGHHHHHHDSGSDTDPGNNSISQTTESFQPDEPDMVEVKDWYKEPTDIHMGQIGGLDTDSMGNVIVFHRGSNEWDAYSFDANEVYAKQDEGAIPERTLVKFNQSGTLLDSWGDNMFYLPHGLTIDKDDNIWLTDVALHQVFKFTSADHKTAALTLGQKFKPGNDEETFCKPTDVAVMKDGSFFVSDGYCNGRIIQFDKQGHVLRQWGSPAMNHRNPAPNKFRTVHSLVLSEPKNLLCVADRDNKRIQCFDLEGNFLYKYDESDAVFALAFRPDSDKLVVAIGNQAKDYGKLKLLHVTSEAAQQMGEFTPVEKKFAVLHDVAVSGDGKKAYVAQLSPPYVYQFSLHPKYHSEVVNAGGSGYMGPSDSGRSTPSQRVPILVAVMLTVPIVCVLLALLIYNCCNRRERGLNGKFDMGNIFNGNRNTAGFSPLATNEDHYTDEEEEFNAEKRTFIVKP